MTTKAHPYSFTPARMRELHSTAARMRSIYDAPISTRKLRFPPTVFDTLTTSQRAGRYLRRACDLQTHEHAEMAVHWGARRMAADKLWLRIVGKEFERIHGRPYTLADYRISGIACDEFSERVKQRLRVLSRFCYRAATLQCAHQVAAGRLATWAAMNAAVEDLRIGLREVFHRPLR